VSGRLYTTKQQGDACEMLVAAELTLAGIPAMKMPDNWPDYDVIAQRPGEPPQRISVKFCAFKAGSANHIAVRGDRFDWLAIVLLDGNAENGRRLFIVPANVALGRSYDASYRGGRGVRVGRVPTLFADYEGNVQLKP
jgi:hypothetical protein